MRLRGGFGQGTKRECLGIIPRLVIITCDDIDVVTGVWTSEQI
jgi:hypothetical protein